MPQPPPDKSARFRRYARLAGWVGGLALLLMVFSLYGETAFLMMMANQLWSCF